MRRSFHNSPPSRCLLLVVCAIACTQPGVMADDRPLDAARVRLTFMQRSADEYHFAVGSSAAKTGSSVEKKAEISRLPEPLLRWDNQVVREDDAVFFLWVHHKRPVCGAQFFLQGDVWHHEFQSLTDAPFQVSWREDAWTWSPQRPGLEFQRADLDAPAAKAPLRLRQMRTFVERFTATTDTSGTGGAKNGTKELHALRLLPTPIYRYADDRDLLDGALFAFVQGTNPEVLLLIEALRDGGPGRWQYGFAPMTSFAAEVKRDEKVVWKRDVVDVVGVRTRDTKGPYQFRYRVLPWSESK